MAKKTDDKNKDSAKNKAGKSGGTKKINKKSGGSKSKKTPKQKGRPKKTTPKKSSKKPTPKKTTAKKSGKKVTKKAVKRDRFASNYNAIRSLLWKEYKKEWTAQGKTYREFIAKGGVVSQTYQRCKTIETERYVGRDKKRHTRQAIISRCTPEEIRGIYGEVTGAYVPPPPRIPESLKEPRPFWGLDTEIDFSIIPNYVTIVSPMLMAAPAEFQPQQYVYENTFQGFVDWCNELYERGEWAGSDDAPMVRMGEPYYDDHMNRWEIEVYSCDADGNRVNYGYIPTPELPSDIRKVPEIEMPSPPDFDELEDEGKLPGEPPEERRPIPPAAISPELALQKERTRQMEIELELAKQKSKSEEVRLETIKQYMEMLDKDVISKADFKNLMKKLQ